MTCREYKIITPLVLILGRGILSLATEVAKAQSLGMVIIPGGSFVRDDDKTVAVSAFSLFATETTWSQWQSVRDWASEHGYEIPGGIGQANCPVQNITWYDCVKWVNALSEIEGRTPCYYEDVTHAEVYRRGEVILTNAHVKWNANGYRLPTEAEWEYAYRAGTPTKYYWGDYAREDRINTKYAAVHYWVNPEITGGPNDVAGKLPNAFGLYDMAGNVEEWCWDWYVPDYEGASTRDPRGPDTGLYRVMRGGGMVMDRMFGAVDRHFTYPWYISMDVGFRVASSDPKTTAETLTRVKTLAIPPEVLNPFSVEKKLTFRSSTDEAVAKRLFGHIELDTPGLEKTRDLFHAGEYALALSAYRDYFVDKLKAGPLAIERPVGPNLAEADAWVEIAAEKRRIRWFGPGSDFKTVWGENVSQNLAAAWMQTGEQVYLDAWAWYVVEKARFHKTEWNALTKGEKASRPTDKDPGHYWYQWSIGYDAGSAMVLPKQVAHIVKNPPAGATPVIPPKALANVLIMTVEECVGIGLQDDRANVPNQAIGNGIALIEQGLVLNEFKDAPSWLDLGIRRVIRASGTVMPDGTDIEYSINYNQDFVAKVDQLNALYADGSEHWLKNLNQKSHSRIRMYACLLMPSGAFPSIGNQAYEVGRPRRDVENWVKTKNLPDLESAYEAIYNRSANDQRRPAFTSVALPYGGYYTLRSGWGTDDLYLFMKSSRPGSGHRHADNNGIQVAAFGRHLLVDCASPPYGPEFLPDHQKMDNAWFDEDRYFGSSFSANTVVVDGCGQKNPAKTQPDRGYTTPDGSRWHSSEQFDFTEGTFRDGYKSDEPLTDQQMTELITGYGREALAEMIHKNDLLKQAGVREVDAIHHRQVIFVKEGGLWIVNDRVEGGEKYTQIWNYPPPHEGENSKNFICPGFAPGQVRADESTKAIKTIDNRGPNIFLYHFIDSPMQYEQKFGEKYPHRGWFSFGIGGEKVPAVQMHATWTGHVPLVTVLKPSRNREDRAVYKPLNSRTVSGFEVKEDEDTIIYQTAAKLSELTAGPVTITGEVLLGVIDQKGVINGMAMGCTEMAVDGNTLNPHQADFEFELVEGKLKTVKPIIIPTAFKWVEIKNGLVPAYE